MSLLRALTRASARFPPSPQAELQRERLRGLPMGLGAARLPLVTPLSVGRGYGGRSGGASTADVSAQEEASAEEVLAARLACVAAASAVRNQKTLQVLLGAWGPLLVARIAVVPPGDSGGDGGRLSLRLVLALHAL